MAKASSGGAKENRLQSVYYALISFSVVIVIWILATSFTSFGDIFPGPLEVLRLFVLSLYQPIGKHTILVHVLFSLRRVVIGFSIGAIIGNTIGLLMGNFRVVDAIVRPVFELVRPIPGIAWIPLAILWFGIGETSKYFIIGFSTFVICTLNSYAGARRVNPDLIGAAKMLGATDRQVIYKIVLPSSVPQIFAGLQVAISTAWHTVLAAEMVRSSEGAGWIIIKGMETGDITRILVGLISIGITGMLLATFMRIVERRVVAWNYRGA